MTLLLLKNSVGDYDTFAALSSVGHHRPASLVPELSAVRPGEEGMVIVRSKDGWSEECLCRWGAILGTSDQPHLTLPGEKRTYARLGLIAVSQVIVEEDGRQLRLSRLGGQVFLIGAVWQPVNPFSFFPGSFAVLDAPTSEDLVGRLARAPVPVSARNLTSWLDHRVQEVMTHTLVEPSFYECEEIG